MKDNGYYSPHTCQTCGTTFMGGQNARYCPNCATQREKEQNRAWSEAHKEERRAYARERRAKMRANKQQIIAKLLHKAKCLNLMRRAKEKVRYISEYSTLGKGDVRVFHYGTWPSWLTYYAPRRRPLPSAL